MLMKQPVLLPNGDITVCCSDLNSKDVIGNTRDRDVVPIYRSRERMRYLELLLEGGSGLYAQEARRSENGGPETGARFMYGV